MESGNLFTVLPKKLPVLNVILKNVIMVMKALAVELITYLLNSVSVMCSKFQMEQFSNFHATMGNDLESVGSFGKYVSR